MLGHASAALTLDTYSDLFDDDLDAVADRLNEVAQPPVRKAILKHKNGGHPMAAVPSVFWVSSGSGT